MKNILITGGAGFIGSNFVNLMVKKYGDKYRYIVYDKMTYAANIENLKDLSILEILMKITLKLTLKMEHYI